MSDTDEPTDTESPWAEINPPMVSAPRPVPLATCSDRLKPASNIEFRNELTACLALVVPVGMTEDARREWLSVAWATVGHLPADLLAIGAKKARETSDHPSKIVPAILAETRDLMDRRREACRTVGIDTPRLPSPERCTPEQAREILAEYGLGSQFSSSRTT